jgi:Arc/MetJ-type ribon-helix-helix transcriptional regulator
LSVPVSPIHGDNPILVKPLGDATPTAREPGFYAIMKLTTQAGQGKFKPMTINVKPETEQLVQEEIQNGHFRSVDEIIVEGVQAWREKHRSKQIGSEQRRKAVEDALAFAKDKAIPLGGISIKDLIHEGHRL